VRGAKLREELLGKSNRAEENHVELAPPVRICRERAQQLAGWALRIKGIEISDASLNKARTGLYTDWSLRATSPIFRQKYFIKIGKKYQLKREIVESVEFDLGNALQLSEDHLQERFDIVFFRNVFMYFSSEAAKAAISQIAHVLKPGGYLFLGAAESLRGISQDFHLCHTYDSFYYRQKPVTAELVVRTPAMLPVASEVLTAWLTNPASDATLGLEDVSWFEAILQSGRRIEVLGQKTDPKTETPAAGLAARSFDGEVDRARIGLMDLLRRECYDDAVSLIESLPKAVRLHNEILLLEAILALNRGDCEKAEEHCRVLLSQNEMNATAHYVMALCRESRLDHDTAISHHRTAIYLDPAFAMPHLHLALIMKKRNDFRFARREFIEAVRLLPQEIDARLLLLGGGLATGP
jgi:chemotaxis protein methyltransferase CheR